METGAEPAGEPEVDGEIDDLAEGEAEIAGETAGDAVDVETADDPRETRPPSVLDRIQDELDGVERALARVDEGSYGTCQACGAEIPDERLAADPIARFCAEHEAAAPTA